MSGQELDERGLLEWVAVRKSYGIGSRFCECDRKRWRRSSSWRVSGCSGENFARFGEDWREFDRLEGSCGDWGCGSVCRGLDRVSANGGECVCGDWFLRSALVALVLISCNLVKIRGRLII